MSRARSPWPSRLEIVQGLSGLLLVLFVWAHMFFESSILLGVDAMLWVTRMFEGAHVFDKPYPILVAAAATAVLLLVAVHAVTAMTKFPGSARQYATFHRHMRGMRHTDTTLWYVQVVTGFLMFFLVPVHLYTAIAQPENIGPYASSDRVWSGRYWILYALLLPAVHVHAAVGVYRLAMKWALRPTTNVARVRARLRLALGCTMGFFLMLGTASLVAYMRIGIDHADRAGERYRPEAAAQREAG